MESIPQEHPAQQEHPPQQIVAASAVASGSGTAGAYAYAIRAGRTKHGPRSWKKFEYAQAAITALYPAGLPPHVDHSWLTREVNKQLAGDRNYHSSGFGKISRPTVIRALGTLREANR
jgi:hypothetical protein